MATQNLLKLLLLLMLMMWIVLKIVCCRFGSSGLVIKLNFCSVQTLSTRFDQNFEVEVQTRFEAEVCSVFSANICRGYVESKLNLGRDSEARFGQDF